MNPSDRGGWREVRPGLLILFCGIPVAAGIFFLDALRRALVEGPSLVVVAEEIHGLVPGADVWVAGRPAGRVTDVAFLPVSADDPRRVAVRVVLRRDAAPSMRRDAEARIGRSALLSPPVVKLRPGSPSAPAYDFSDTLVVTSTPGVSEFRALADSGKVAAAALVAELGRLRERMERGSGTLPRLRRDTAFFAALSGRRQAVTDLQARWRVSGLREIVADSALRARAGSIGERLAEAADRRRGGPTEGVRDALPAAIERLEARSARLGGRLADADGTLGRLASDETLRLEAARARALLDSLRFEVGSNPLRHLRFRLF